MGEEIFEIFSEEVTEISQNLLELYPQWQRTRGDRALLTEIRRAFHTLKGSGRMAGAYALGDFAWIHEDITNQLLSRQIKADDRVVFHIGKAINVLQERLTFFLNAQQKDANVITLIAEAEATLLPLEQEPLEMFDFSAPEPVQQKKPEPEPESEPLDMLDFSLPEQTPVEQSEPEPEPESEPLDMLDFSLPEQTPAEQSEPEFEPLDTLDFSSPEQMPAVEQQASQDTAIPTTPLSSELDDATEEAAESRLIWQLFWEEVPEQLQALDRNLQRLRDAPEEQETICELEREFHTLKGGARMAQLSSLADISHEAENLLSGLHFVTRVSEADIEHLQQAVDRLHDLAAELSHPAESANASKSVLPDIPPQTPTEADTPTLTTPLHTWVQQPRGLPNESGSLLEQMLLEQADSLPDISLLESATRPANSLMETAETTTTNNTNPHETIRLPALFIDSLIDRVVELNVQQVHMSEHLSSMGMDVDELVRTVARLRQQIRTLEVESEARIHDGRSKHKPITSNTDSNFDPLEMDQYAEIQRISRSLAESLNDLVNLEIDLATQVRKGEQLLQTDMRSTRKLQRDLLDTRLVAVTMLVPRLRRLTRQVAGELGKQVVLEIQGEECELDRNLLQNMTAPLEHLIRNAISHGLETPEERTKQNKPATGKITLTISRDDAEIVIRFSDDGRGLNRTRLHERALDMGIITKGQTLPETELDRLILRPGFSTASSVSQIAGRGIGMDVVHSELKALGGSLQISSKPNEGVEFAMHLPFTLVVNPVLLGEIQGQIYAIPISGVQGLARISGRQLQEAFESDTAILEFAGQPYVLHHLTEVLGMPRGDMTFDAEERFPVIFIELQGQAVAWIIDTIRGRREVVLQPLGSLFKNCRLYSAATVSPDGSVFLVPDMAELARQATIQHNQPSLPDAETLPPEEPIGPPRVLIVDDSITVRRVTEKFLSTRDYTVLSAKDGMEALERMSEFQPDVVLLDIEMPRMDGFELLGHLRRDPQWAKLPIIMISSRTAQKHREHAGALGATGFLGKPYQNEVLLDALQEVLTSGHETDNTHDWENMPV